MALLTVQNVKDLTFKEHYVTLKELGASEKILALVRQTALEHGVVLASTNSLLL
jgi:hypothetical protein